MKRLRLCFPQALSRRKLQRDPRFHYLYGYQRTLHYLGALSPGRPGDLLVTDSSPYCAHGQKSCHIDLSDVAPPGGHDPHRGTQWAVRLVVAEGVPYRPTRGHLWRDPRVFVPCGTIQNWVEAGGKKGPRADGPYVSGLGA